jgi:hypothetical protein
MWGTVVIIVHAFTETINRNRLKQSGEKFKPRIRRFRNAYDMKRASPLKTTTRSFGRIRDRLVSIMVLVMDVM